MNQVKTLLSIVIAMALFMVIFSDCSKETEQLPVKSEPIKQNQSERETDQEEPVRLLLDIEFASSAKTSVEESLQKYRQSGTDKSGKPIWTSFQEVVSQQGGPEIQVEIPPSHGQERDSYLTHLRTELMAGEGPDVFVCMSGMGYYWDKKRQEGFSTQPIFKFPQQAINRSTFLALDNYLERTHFIKWERLTTMVMEAGRNREAQYVLPMTYTIPAGIFFQADVKQDLSQTMTWKDMLSGEPALRAVALNCEPIWTQAALEPLCDFDSDTLAISESDLLDFFAEKANCNPESNLVFGMGSPRVGIDIYLEETLGLSPEDDIALVPIYNQQGGYMANINSFAAINANTKKPEDAFFLLDYLLGEECQKSLLYSHMTFDRGIPVMEGLMEDGKHVSSGSENPNWQMWDNFYIKFTDLRDGLNGAYYSTPISEEIQELCYAIQENNGQRIEKLVHDAYMRMSMELAES